MSNVQTNYRLKLEFQKMNQHKGEKWLIYGTKHYKENHYFIVDAISHFCYKLCCGLPNLC